VNFKLEIKLPGQAYNGQWKLSVRLSIATIDDDYRLL